MFEDSNVQVSWLIYLKLQMGLFGSCNMISACCQLATEPVVYMDLHGELWPHLVERKLAGLSVDVYSVHPLFEMGNNSHKI